MGAPAPTPGVSFAPGLAYGAPGPTARELSRASQARLNRHGMTAVIASDPGFTAADLMLRPDIQLELCDSRACNEITFQFAAYRAPGRTDPLPKSLYFSYQFYDRPPVRSPGIGERAVLMSEAAGGSMSNATSRILVRDAGPRSRDHAAVVFMKFSR